MKSTIVAILYPGCIFFEVALALELLAKKYEIVFATPTGDSHLASNGTIIKNCVAYSEINLDQCKAILIPGGDPESIIENKDIDYLLTAADKKNLLIAAICAGPLVLAKSGLLKGKKIAHGFGAKEVEFLKSYFEGVQLTNDKFVADGRILTAIPEAHIDFAVEIACRLDCVDANKANRTKDYYRGILGRRIRPLTLALIQNSKGQFLFHKAQDKIKNEFFYRPLGGGIEFAESGQIALEREIREELNLEVSVGPLMASFENIFTFEGHPGHEIVMLFPATFKDKKAYDLQELDIVESGVVINKAVWRSLEEIFTEGAKLYPNGLDKVLLGLGIQHDV